MEPRDRASLTIQYCNAAAACHRSVVISLRLLPKLLGSFQHGGGGGRGGGGPSAGGGSDTNSDAFRVLRWVESELGMLKHFFNDLVHYTNRYRSAAASPQTLSEMCVHRSYSIVILIEYLL